MADEIVGRAKYLIDADTSAMPEQLSRGVRRAVLSAPKAKIKVEVDKVSLAEASRGISNVATAAMAMGPALLPVMAAVTVAAGALGAALGTAAAAGGIFGASVAGVTKEMTKAKEDMVKAGDAVGKWNQKVEMSKAVLDNTKKGTKEYDAALKIHKANVAKAEVAQKGLNAQQDDFNKKFGPAAKGLENVKKGWGAFMDATRPTTVKIMGQGMDILAKVLPRLAPIANAAGKAIGSVLTDIGKFTTGSGFQSFISFLTVKGPGYIKSFASITGNVISGVISLFQGFLPMSDSVVGGLDKMTARFAAWAAGLSNTEGFRTFIEYAKVNAPTVMAFVVNLFNTIVKVVTSLAPFGGTMLGILTTVTGAIAKLPVETVQALAKAFGVVILTMKAAQAVMYVVATAQRIAAAATLVWAGAQRVLNFVMKQNPIAKVIAVIALLVGAFILAYKKSETFRRIVDGAMSGIKSAVTSMWGAVKPVFNAFKNFFKDQVQPAFKTAVGKIGVIFDSLKAAAMKPINFVIGTIYNDGLRKALNLIPGVNLAAAKLINGGSAGKPGEGGRSLKGGMQAYASGGVLPGYTPGKDVHQFYSPTGGGLSLSGGEAIMRPEFARAMGGKKGIARLNAMARKGYQHFAQGGVFGGGSRVVPGGGNQHSGYPWARYAGDFPNPTGTAVHSWKDGIVSAVKYLTTSYGKHVRINHNGEETLYAHLSRILVNAGQSVKGGQKIGEVGNTGRSFGSHLHWEVKGGNGKIGSGKGEGVLQKIMKFVGSPTEKILSGLKSKMAGPLNSPWGKIASQAASGAITKATAFAKKAPEALWNKVANVVDGSSSFNMPKGDAVTRWAPLVRQALQRTGLPMSLEDNWLRQIASESGGNPRAVQGNIGDINNRSGDLAKGLVQVIGATFKAFRDPSLPNDRFNPLSSLVAGMRYASSRYGNLENVIGHGHGYAGGGVLPGFSTGGIATKGGWARVGEHGAETIRIPGGTQIYPHGSSPGSAPKNNSSESIPPIILNIDLGEGITKRIEISQRDMDGHREYSATRSSGLNSRGY